jgi:hypothetical protein
MGYWRKQFEKVAAKAIANYAGIYGTDAADTGIGMCLDAKGKASFCTLIKNVFKEKVKFLHIYHGPGAILDITGMAYVIPAFITKALQQLAQENIISAQTINVNVKWEKGEGQEPDQVYLFLMDGKRMIKLLREEDVLSDDQVAATQLEEL